MMARLFFAASVLLLTVLAENLHQKPRQMFAMHHSKMQNIGSYNGDMNMDREPWFLRKLNGTVRREYMMIAYNMNITVDEERKEILAWGTKYGKEKEVGHYINKTIEKSNNVMGNVSLLLNLIVEQNNILNSILNQTNTPKWEMLMQVGQFAKKNMTAFELIIAADLLVLLDMRKHANNGTMPHHEGNGTMPHHGDNSTIALPPHHVHNGTVVFPPKDSNATTFPATNGGQPTNSSSQPMMHAL